MHTFAELFHAADTKKTGVLDRSEFVAVLRHQSLGLSDQMVNRLVAEADDNKDGLIQYSCALVFSLNVPRDRC